MATLISSKKLKWALVKQIAYNVYDQWPFKQEIKWKWFCFDPGAQVQAFGNHFIGDIIRIHGLEMQNFVMLDDSFSDCQNNPKCNTKDLQDLAYMLNLKRFSKEYLHPQQSQAKSQEGHAHFKRFNLLIPRWTLA
ncbi:hypothetical protein Fmac_008387 [Flemingia macrophylla]|uniref:Uncharacterized protein n=1 Tax=Flemingia macrophylla TaxID=520843 RepID=A0ABD1MX85_9FABA